MYGEAYTIIRKNTTPKPLDTQRDIGYYAVVSTNKENRPNSETNSEMAI
jgi:hypothetical protein